MKVLIPILLAGIASQAIALAIEDRDGDIQLVWDSDPGMAYEFDHTTNLSHWSRSSASWLGTGTPLQANQTEITGTSLRQRGFFRLAPRYQNDEEGNAQDMLHPAYYNAPENDALRNTLNEFIYFCQQTPLHHPLQNGTNAVPGFNVSFIGVFGAPKPPPNGTAQHHAAVDLHVGSGATTVDVFAAWGGTVTTHRDSNKYRHHIAISSAVTNDTGQTLGTMVIIYAHVDLDLDEAGGLLLDGQTVEAGDLVSKNLYAGTMGGPHLHFEIRYYRPGEAGNEEFYNFVMGSSTTYTKPSAGSWLYGYWMPSTGYGFGDPRNHGLPLY